MTRKFKTVDYEETLDLQISLRDALPPDHLARFVVDVIAQLDLSGVYKQYSDQGAPPYAPEVMLGLLFYGYAVGVFSARKVEKATYEVIPFRFIAGDMHPDHDTIAHFRQRFLAELKELFVQILLIAQEMGHLQLGNISLDGSKIHADASKSKAVSYKRLLAINAYLQAEVNELFTLAEAADGGQLPEEMNIQDEIERRQQQLARLAEAKKVLEARAQARYEAEKAAYDAKMQVREEKTEAKEGRKPPGRPPKPPIPGPREKDQYNFTDPESRIMKNATNDGFDQHYNTQIVVDHDSRLIVGNWLCNHTNDKQAALPTIDTVPPELGQAKKANLDTGYFSEANVNTCESNGIVPYIPEGKQGHNEPLHERFADDPPAPPQPGVVEAMRHRLNTREGKAVYARRKSTVETVFGIIKQVQGFRQFLLRGLDSVSSEWSLVCIGWNLKRLHALKG